MNKNMFAKDFDRVSPHLRVHYGFTQQEVAAYVGCSQGHVSHVECGRTKWSWPERRLLAEFFGIKIIDDPLTGLAVYSVSHSGAGWPSTPPPGFLELSDSNWQNRELKIKSSEND